jgi:hypothetical protein
MLGLILSKENINRKKVKISIKVCLVIADNKNIEIHADMILFLKFLWFVMIFLRESW